MAFTLDSHLEDKSYLTFEFKKTDGGTFRKGLNFLENITINESVATNYGEYTPIGSNGSVFAYMGAKSRKLELSFNLTLPHIQEFTQIRSNFVDKDGMKSLYFRNTDLNTAEIDPTKSLAAAVAHFDFQHYSQLTFQEKQDIERLLSRYKGFGLVTQSGLSPKIQNNNDRRTKTLFQLMYWVNLIRSSVLTNSRKPYLGPPLVILTHGMMYMSVPCICESYTISPNEKLGYDTETLLPRVMEVKMNLREVRLRGASHVPGIAGQSRHMPGWDSLYSEDTASDSNFVTIDPFDQTNNIINID